MVHTAKICYVTKEYLQLIHPEITMCDWQDVITHLLINEPSTNKKVMFVTCPGQSLIHLSRLVSCFFRAARVFLSTSFSVHRIIFSTSHNQAYRHTYPCLLLSQIWLLSKNFVCLLLLFFSCRYEQHQSLLNRPSWVPPPSPMILLVMGLNSLKWTTFYRVICVPGVLLSKIQASSVVRWHEGGLKLRPAEPSSLHCNMPTDSSHWKCVHQPPAPTQFEGDTHTRKQPYFSSQN